jgi:hypothetical protein
MATFYLDFENGNDANSGTTFANRWKTITNGATAARIAPGDEIRIMASPSPTSLGQNGVWTSQALRGTQSINSSTNATPISITRTSHGYSTGDTVVITGHSVNTNANGTWEITVTGANTFTLDGSVGNGTGAGTGTVRLRNNTVVRLASSVTQNIASTGPGRAAWTTADAVNVTTSFNTTDFKEHNQSDSIAIGAGFVTGKTAYWTLPSTLDLSGYQQVSFWIRQTAGTVGAAGAVDLRLCSDTLGNTAVDTISIPSLAATGRWMPVTVDLGTNLGSSIQSIALYVNTDNGAQTFLLNNIIACKASSSADSLTLASLIGKNISGETFWGIQSINGTRVMLDGSTNVQPNSTSVRGYYGTSETVTTWKRETIKLGPAAAGNTQVQATQDSGTADNPIVFSGGWNRTDMSTQTSETWLDAVNGNGRLIFINNNGINFSTVAVVRAEIGIYVNNGQVINLDIIAVNNNGSAVSLLIPTFVTQTIGHAVANTNNTIIDTTANSRGIVNLVYSASSNANSALLANGSNATVLGTTANTQIANNGAFAITRSNGIAQISNIIMQDNGSGDVQGTSVVPTTYLTKCVLGSATEVSTGSSYVDQIIYSQNHDQTPDNHKIFQRGALISSATDQRKTASGISWKIQPTSAERNSNWPISLSLAKVACSANNLVTVKAWMRRNNAGLTMRLVCKGGQIAGVTSDVTASVTTTDAWEEETITFTPTETGVVEITAEAWGGTTFSGWVDDMTISQA